MGATISSNLSSAMTQVSNTVQASSTAATNQADTCIHNQKWENCTVGGNFNATNACDVIMQSRSIIDQMQNNNLKNTIAQQLAQTAESAVGLAGIGFAEANNTAYTYANATSSIADTVSAITTQNATDIQNFTCEGSDFLGNFTYNVSNSAEFMSEQMLTNISSNTVMNDVNQSIQQKAIATTEGLAGLIIAIAILIVAIGWVLFRPLQLGMGSRLFIIILFVTLLLVFIFVMAWFQLPPFFSKPATCIGISGPTIGACNPGIDCTDVTDKISIYLEKPPLRYAFPIIGQGDTSLGEPSQNYQAGLLQMVISKHGGWTESAYADFNSDPNYQPSGGPLPMPLVESGGKYITNKDVWNSYVNNPDNASKARFILASDLQLETYVRMYDNEQCYIGKQSNAPGSSETLLNNNNVYQDDEHCYRFVPDIPPATPKDAVMHGGNITGRFGYCDTGLYRFQKYFRIASLIVLVLIIILLIIVFLQRPKPAPTQK